MLWMMADLAYLTALFIFLTVAGPYILELMRALGVWAGLGIAATVFLLGLLLLPGLVAWKVKKARFGQMCLAWCVLLLATTFAVAPVGHWVRSRGSFVPALVWGPDSAVVEKVAIKTLGLGEEWKKRPSLALPDSIF